MSPAETTILGIVSGIFTSAILFVLSKVFSQVLLPWYRNLIYTGTDISGEWYCYGRDLFQNAKFELIQQASILCGRATYIHSDDEDLEIEKIRTFSVTGIIDERFVQLTLKHVDRSRLGLISYLLEVQGDGRRLVGAGCFYQVNDSEIDTTPLLFSRSPLSKNDLEGFWAFEEDNEDELDDGISSKKVKPAVSKELGKIGGKTDNPS